VQAILKSDEGGFGFVQLIINCWLRKIEANSSQL